MSGPIEAPHAVIAPQVFYEERIGDRVPGQVAPGSSKVGFTLRKSGKILQGFAFLINPQGLTRTDGSRAQLFATRGHFYVDDFGPAPTTIQMRQLVASGKRAGDDRFYVAIEDVQRFLKLIYLPATQGPGKTEYAVYFHDHHFERGFEQRVYFPPNSLVVARSVDQHGVLSVDLTMVGLEKYPYGEVEPTKTTKPKTKLYTVKRGDTLTKLVARLAGRKATKKQRAAARTKLLNLNPQLRKKRILKDGVTVAKALRVYPGEVLRLPT